MTYATAVFHENGLTHITLNKFSNSVVSALAALTKMPLIATQPPEEQVGFQLKLGVAKLEMEDVEKILILLSTRVPKAIVTVPQNADYFLNVIVTYLSAGGEVPKNLVFALSSHDNMWNIRGLTSVLQFKASTPSYKNTHALRIMYAP